MKVWINEKKQMYFCVKICFPAKIEPVFPDGKGEFRFDSGLEGQFL